MQNSKTVLRTSVRQKKQLLSQEEIRTRSQQLCRMVLGTEAYRKAHTIFGYLPFNQEVDLTHLLLHALSDGKQIALPKCYGKEMRFILISDLSRIQYTSFGVPEPVDDDPVADDPSGLVIVPGLVFDRLGYRIGYGGGYYDRFLSVESDHPTIGLCYDFQLTDRLEPEPHDIPVDTVFSI